MKSHQLPNGKPAPQLKLDIPVAKELLAQIEAEMAKMEVKPRSVSAWAGFLLLAGHLKLKPA